LVVLALIVVGSLYMFKHHSTDEIIIVVVDDMVKFNKCVDNVSMCG
jgi:hypothetical protein